jgi:hypothetical protein
LPCYWSYVPQLSYIINRTHQSCGSGPLEFLISPSVRGIAGNKKCNRSGWKNDLWCGKKTNKQ